MKKFTKSEYFNDTLFRVEEKENISLKSTAGFTLVETLVAIAIFSMSIVGLMSVLGGGISNTNYVKNKIVASYLAQEGIEYMRNIRDTYDLYGTPATKWADFLTKISLCEVNSHPDGCYFDDSTNPNYAFLTSPNMFGSCEAIPNNPCITKYNSTTGVYSYKEVDPNSIFTRSISFKSLSINEIRITSKVTWYQNSNLRSVSFSTNLLNWR